jgi:excisionase family DNA binding protein
VASTTEPWVSVEDVAAHLGVAKDSVYRWIEAKHMPAHKIGKLWKFKLSEVDEWVRGGGANEVAKGKSVRKARSRKRR